MKKILASVMIAVAMIGVGASQANAAGGGRYSYNHPDSNYTVNFMDNGWPGDRFSYPRPSMSQWTPPGRNAAGLHYVDYIWSPKPGYMQCDNDKFRIALPANKWTRACAGDLAMVVVVK